MSIEKSSKIILLKEDILLFSKGELPNRVKICYGITSYSELKKLIDLGEFEVEES